MEWPSGQYGHLSCYTRQNYIERQLCGSRTDEEYVRQFFDLIFVFWVGELLYICEKILRVKYTFLTA
jgi:hypothetical protein